MSQPAPWFHTIEQRLLSQREVLRSRLRAVEADRRRTSAPLSADFEEQSTERENDQVLDSLLAVDLSELRRVERALQRLRAGTYGLCMACHAPIEVKRLEAVPDAESCARCAVDPEP
jgi:RNA polymerase-binding transcription factor DksA